MIDIVLQGEITEYAESVASHYAKLPFVNKIILSGWEGDRGEGIKSVKPPPGVGNRNLQIKSSMEGLKLCETQVSVKMRNDQKVSLESMQVMYEYYEANKKPGVIFVPGIFPTFPFHPRDHIFWGETNDLKTLFDIPYDTTSLSDDYNKYLRSEAYICMWYYARKNEEAKFMAHQPELFLLDSSLLRDEAIELTKRLNLFQPFPKIDFEWPKYGMKEYHYQFTKETYGEYQA